MGKVVFVFLTSLLRSEGAGFLETERGMVQTMNRLIKKFYVMRVLVDNC